MLCQMAKSHQNFEDEDTMTLWRHYDPMKTLWPYEDTMTLLRHYDPDYDDDDDDNDDPSKHPICHTIHTILSIINNLL